MKSIRNILWNSRRPNPVHQQMELPLAGSHLTRDEAGFLIEIRKLREQLAKAA